eukprot:Platyproteum_vivax@DN4414_c0_g1_i1.p1
MTEWVHGICGCCKHPGTAVLACFCPCVVMGNIAKDLHMEFCTFCLCGNAITLRAQIRERDGIEGGCMGDCFTGCCCMCCSLSQTANQAREGGKLLEVNPGQMAMP